MCGTRTAHVGRMSTALARQQRNVRFASIGLGAAAVLMALPFWPALLLAAWTSQLTMTPMRKLAPKLGGRTRAAAMLTALLATVCFTPLLVLGFVAVHEATELYARLRESGAGKGTLLALVAPNAQGGDPAAMAAQLGEVAKEYGARAWSAIVMLAGTATAALVGVLVYFWGTFVLLCEGPRPYAWLERHVELPPAVTRAFRDAFVETGRGLLVGVGATSLVQSAVATAAYFALGLPRALLLGAMTLVFSVIPALGPAVVWGPVAIALFVSGQNVKGGVLVGIGVFLIGTIDNLVRPLFVRFGRLQLSSFAVFLGMLGGLTVVGPFGILLGPLVLRLAREALEQREARARLPIVP